MRNTQNKFEARNHQNDNPSHAGMNMTQPGNVFLENPFIRDTQSGVFNTHSLGETNGTNLHAQTSYANNYGPLIQPIPGNRQWSQAVFPNRPNVRFLDRIGANSYIQQ